MLPIILIICHICYKYRNSSRLYRIQDSLSSLYRKYNSIKKFKSILSSFRSSTSFPLLLRHLQESAFHATPCDAPQLLFQHSSFLEFIFLRITGKTPRLRTATVTFLYKQCLAVDIQTDVVQYVPNGTVLFNEQ